MSVVAVVWLEHPIIKWCRERSLPAQISGALGVTAMIILAGYGISAGLRGDFQAPPEWKSRWQATVDRLVAAGDEDEGEKEFELIDRRLSVRMGCAFLGNAICGLWFLNRRELNPSSTGHRCVNVLLGVPMLLAILLVGEPQFGELVGETTSNSLMLLLLPPLAGIALPCLTEQIFRS